MPTPSSPDASIPPPEVTHDPDPATGASAKERLAPPKPYSGRREYFFGLVGSWLLRLLAATIRFRTENIGDIKARPSGESFIFVFWHNRLMLIPVAWQRFLQPPNDKGGRALTSTSSDGEIIAQFLQRFGISPVRGSASRRGSTALRELARWLKKGHDIGLTPDGSRGPMYEIKPGLVLLAQLSGKRILPISFEYGSAWRTKSWDRFFIPKPFSEVTFVVGEPITVKRTETPEEFEAERLRCERAIMAQIRER